MSSFECNLCHGTEGSKVPFRYAFKGRFLWLIECKNCKLRSLWPRPTDEEIAEMYTADYFTEVDSSTHHVNDYVSHLKEYDFNKDVEAVKKLAPNGGKVLEIGCATGNFLNELKQQGFQVRGVEVSEFAAGYARKHFGIDVVNQPFSEKLIGKEIAENEFDIVLMGDVLEHFTDPTLTMASVNRIMKKGGSVIINLPGSLNLLSSKLAFLLYKIMGTQKTMTIPPFHLTEFTAETARKMCLQTGFTKVSVKQDVKHPKTLPLRGGFMENLIKKCMQYPNYYLTRWFGVDGDRITVTATK